jgi:hypothetical protein
MERVRPRAERQLPRHLGRGVVERLIDNRGTPFGAVSNTGETGDVLDHLGSSGSAASACRVCGRSNRRRPMSPGE